MMKFEDFCEFVKGNIEDKLEGFDIESIKLNEVYKNNEKLTGLAILEKGSSITPNIYLDYYYNDMVDKGYSEEEVLDRISDVFKKNHLAPYDSKDLTKKFQDYNWVKENVYACLIAKEGNDEMLESVAYSEFLDMAMIYRVQIAADEMGQGTIVVRNEHLKMWGATVEELDAIARENTLMKKPASAQNMIDVIRSMGVPVDDFPMQQSGPQQIVITNEEKLFGAATALLDTNLLDKLSAKYDSENLIVLPSSIHEIIVVTGIDGDIEEYNQMVKEVNISSLDAVDILSDHAYAYNSSTHKLMMPEEYTAELTKTHSNNR